MVMKKEIHFDFVRSFIDAADIDSVFLKNFPEEAKWSPLAAVDQFAYGDIDIDNGVPWIDHLNNIPPLPKDSLADIAKSAAKTSGAAIAVTGSKAAIISAKAGIDFFKNQGQKPEIIFLESGDYKAGIKKLESLDFYICNMDSGNSTPEEQTVLDEVLGIMNSKYGDKSRLLNFNVETGEFKGGFCILSPASLFLLSARGINIEEIVSGAELEPMPEGAIFVPQACGDGGIGKEHMIPHSYSVVKYYSIIRSMMLKQGKSAETICWLDPRFKSLAAWIKNLFNENTFGISTDEKLLSAKSVPDQNTFETVLEFAVNSFETKNSENPDAANKSLINEIARNRTLSRSPLLRAELLDDSPRSYGSFVAFLSRVSRMVWE